MTGQEIKLLRKRLHLTQEEFGKALGYSAPQVRVHEIESGKSAVSAQIEMLCRYIERFGVLTETQHDHEEEKS